MGKRYFYKALLFLNLLPLQAADPVQALALELGFNAIRGECPGAPKKPHNPHIPQKNELRPKRLSLDEDNEDKKRKISQYSGDDSLSPVANIPITPPR